MISFTVESGAGLAEATTYVTVEEANDIASMNIHSSDAWLALPLDAKRNLLIYASRVLDSRTVWNGTQATANQALAWPRSGVEDRYGNSISTSAVPYNVRWAVVELAKHTLAEDRISKTQPDSIISEAKIDTVTVKFADPTTAALNLYKTPAIVCDLLSGLGTVRDSSRKISFGKLTT